jgi:Arc/MetJ-type ribon-helix-helix transcriptional regulator
MHSSSVARRRSLTTLEGADTPGKVRELCAKAAHPGGDAPRVAAVCVYSGPHPHEGLPGDQNRLAPHRPLSMYYVLCYSVLMKTVTVRLDDKSHRELEQAAEELGESTSELVRRAIHLAWFTTMQERMRRESAEIASDPAELEEAARIREWARFLAS